MKEKECVKTSEEWLKEYEGLRILDPDGWDRSNYQYSFFEEKITKQEFDRRVAYSTVIVKISGNSIVDEAIKK